jgi:hypothetical protein
VFTKGIASAILDNMQTALGGLGQVRVKEIELLQQAMAAPHNTIEANRTLLNMAIRGVERTNGYAAMARDYASGAAVINPFSGKNEVLLPATPDGAPRRNIDARFDQLAAKVSETNPPFTPEEIANQHGVWERDKATKPDGTPKFATPTSGILQMLDTAAKREGGLTDVEKKSFEKHYGPVDKYLKPQGQ